MKKLFLAILFFFALSGWLIGGYFWKQEQNYVTIEMTYAPQSLPNVPVKIGDLSYQFFLDLGSDHFFKCRKEIIEPLEAKKIGYSESMDCFGNLYQPSKYFYKTVFIDSYPLEDVVLTEYLPEFITNTTIGDSTKSTSWISDPGVIGNRLLERVNLLCDFPKSRLYLCKDFRFPEHLGYRLDEFTKVPFQEKLGVIIIEAETSVGTKHLLLDTGSTITALKNLNVPKETCATDSDGLSYITSTLFRIQGTDFGPIRLTQIDSFNTFSEFDGPLGMDFLKDTILFIDYPKKILYLKKTIRQRIPAP